MVLPYRLSICGVQEIGRFVDSGVSHVLSILDPGTPEPEALLRIAPRARMDLRFHDVVVDQPDRPQPNEGDVERVLAFGAALADDAVDHLLVHCWAGVSRSTAAAILLMAQHRPEPTESMFATLAEIRPRSWPNSTMIRIGDAKLGLGGRLVRAVRQHHHAQAQRYPDLAALIREVGRGHEMPPT